MPSGDDILLFFGYDRAVSGQIDPTIFRVTLGTIVLTIFLFVYSAAGYYLFMEASLRRLPNAEVHLRKANFFLTAAIVGITLEPALILYAARLTGVSRAGLRPVASFTGLASTRLARLQALASEYRINKSTRRSGHS